MTEIWLGALLVFLGLLFLAAQAIWKGRLSRWPARPAAAGQTLEPPERGGGFGYSANWPGFAMVALGAILLLAGAIL